MTVTVSVVIPTYKRDDQLIRCLSALINQDYNPADFEIIVVDDAASEKTRSVVREFIAVNSVERFLPEGVVDPIDCEDGQPCASADVSEAAQTTVTQMVSFPNIRYLQACNAHGPAAARNIGWRSASGPIIAFTDDDCIPRPNWISSGAASLADGVAGVSGQVIVPLPTDPTDYQNSVSYLERSEFVTANCFYKRTALECIGGFDERFLMAWREDTDVYFSMLEKSYRLEFAPSAIVVHPVSKGKWGVSAFLQKKAMYNALLYKKHAELYKLKVQRTPPIRYYLITISFLIGLAGLLMGLSTLALASLITWSILVVAFIRMRLLSSSRRAVHIAEMIATSMVIPLLSVFWRIKGGVHFRVFFL